MSNNILGTIQGKSSSTPYNIVSGINDNQVVELIQLTQSDTALASTSDWRKPDGAPGRFSSLDSYQDWFHEGKFNYTLIDPSHNLVGISWFSYDPQTTSGATYGFTFGLRLYGSARGIGLAKPFSRTVSNHFFASSDYLDSPHRGIWLRTGSDNLAAIKTYESLGYRKVKDAEIEGKITMVLQYQSL